LTAPRSFTSSTPLLAAPPEAHFRRSGARSQGLPAGRRVELILDDDLRSAVEDTAGSFAA